MVGHHVTIGAQYALAITNRGPCVKETYAAAVALYQSHVATDPRVRHVAAIIARDEARHAALALRIFTWADAHIDDDARADVARGLARALDELAREPPSATVVCGAPEVGLPSRAAARALVTALEGSVWRPLLAESRRVHAAPVSED